MFSNSSHSVACVRISSLLRKQCRHNQSLGKPPIPGNWQLSFLKFKGWWNSLTLLFPSSSLSIQLIFIGCTRNKLYSFEMWSHPRFENCFCSSSQWNMIHTVTFINRKKIKANRLWKCSVLLSANFQNKIPHSGWLKQQKFISSQF